MSKNRHIISELQGMLLKDKGNDAAKSILDVLESLAVTKFLNRNEPKEGWDNYPKRLDDFVVEYVKREDGLLVETYLGMGSMR